MKKVMIILLGLLMMMSSCGTYEATGAASGAYFGSIVGSAIGGITGGWRGSDVGRLIGLAGGAAVGAAVGKAADEKAQQRYDEYAQRSSSRRNQRSWDDNDYNRDDYYERSGYDPTHSGDDRIMIDGMSAPTAVPLELRHIQVLDRNRDGVISRGEGCRVVFEIYNPTSQVAFGVRPMVSEVTGNRHILISENVLIESIAPKQAVRYTAMVKADNRLKDGDAVIRISLQQGRKELNSQTKEFRLRTSKR